LGRPGLHLRPLLTRGKADWTYGFFEIRAKMPCGKGTWPAIWTLGSGGNWPGDGELDILEHMGHTPLRISSAVHTSAGSGGQAVSGLTRLPDACQPSTTTKCTGHRRP
jgi:beta-glucanase (GH16 family)